MQFDPLLYSQMRPGYGSGAGAQIASRDAKRCRATINNIFRRSKRKRSLFPKLTATCRALIAQFLETDHNILKQSRKHRKLRDRQPAVTPPVRPAVTAGVPAADRIAWIDALRGCAIVLMIAYHLCFDLNYFGVLHEDFNRDPLWLGSRTLIVSMFLALVGISLVLSAGREPVWRHFAHRQIRIGACAVLVSAASYAMFPSTFIFFGVLHCIFVASLVGMVLLRGGLPGAAFPVAGALAILAARQWSWPVFDAEPLQWIGFMTHKPATEDYVPLFPWIGVVFLGMAAGLLLQRRRAKPGVAGLDPHVAAASRRAPRLAAWMGRHSLSIYMLHQPVLLGSMYVLLHR